MRFKILLLCAAGAFAQTVNYFQPPEGTTSCAVGINARGDIAGWYMRDLDPDPMITNMKRLGYVRDKSGSFLDLQPPGDNIAHTTAADVNASGDVVGYWAETGTNLFHGFLYRDGQYTPIDYPGGRNTYAIGINAIGEIVGSYQTMIGSEWRTMGFLRTPQGEYQTIRLGVGEYFVRPWAINSRGDIAGQFGYSTAASTWHGFHLSKAGELTVLDPPNKNPNGQSWAIGMNEQGDVTGEFSAVLPDGAIGTRSFIWRNGAYTVFGPDLYARGINPAGTVVGCGWYDSAQRSFVRSAR